MAKFQFQGQELMLESQQKQADDSELWNTGERLLPEARRPLGGLVHNKVNAEQACHRSNASIINLVNEGRYIVSPYYCIKVIVIASGVPPLCLLLQRTLL
uniref:Uncharacterized protein n=1 Tax=Knipowitschia caucasica TaxID=637954 RepID=A0AAV2LMH9_KNICA